MSANPTRGNEGLGGYGVAVVMVAVGLAAAWCGGGGGGDDGVVAMTVAVGFMLSFRQDAGI